MFQWARNLFSGSPRSQAAARLDNARAAYIDRVISARYDAAQTTDETKGLWEMVDLFSAKTANSFTARRTLRTRSRYEIANNSYARGIVTTLANDLIGTGPRLHLRSPNQAANRQVRDAFAQWASAAKLSEKLRTMKLAKCQDGEAFSLFVNNPRIKSPVQLDLKPIEADQVQTPMQNMAAAINQPTQFVDGIILDNLGEPEAYIVLKNHPGDLEFGMTNPTDSSTIAARNILHWFRKDRPGQVRGIPEISTALELFAKLRRYTKAVVEAAEIAADFAAVVETQGPADWQNDPTDGKAFDTLPIKRGMWTTFPWGSKLSQLRAEQPTTTYDNFVKCIIREICRCLNMPLSLALGDASGSNFSSARMEHLAYHRDQKVERGQCEELILDRIFEAWLEEAVMIPGLLPPGFVIVDVPHCWYWDQAESIDPVKDAQATALELANKTTTLEEEWAKKGEDWEDRIEQLGTEKEATDEAGLTPVPVPAKPGAPKPGTGDGASQDNADQGDNADNQDAYANAA